MLKEFQSFINRGNVVDLAVAVVMGTAFGAIVTSLVNDMLMPTMGIVTQSLDFSGLALRVGSAQIAYGKFIQAVVSFLLISTVSFLLVRMVNQMQRRLMLEKNAAPANLPKDVQLLTEIRDLLWAQTRTAEAEPQAEAKIARGDPSPIFIDMLNGSVRDQAEQNADTQKINRSLPLWLKANRR